MNYLDLMKKVLQLMPVITQMVDAIEQLFPAGGNGALKLEMVKGLLTSGTNKGDMAVEAIESIWPMLSVLISFIVKLRK